MLTLLFSLSEKIPDVKSQDLLEQAKQWLHAFNIPEHVLKLSTQNKMAGQVSYTRMSCCFAYQCNGYSFCTNCPKKNKLKNKLSQDFVPIRQLK